MFEDAAANFLGSKPVMEGRSDILSLALRVSSGPMWSNLTLGCH